jgi:CRP-like cAMP-binding protein
LQQVLAAGPEPPQLSPSTLAWRVDNSVYASIFFRGCRTLLGHLTVQTYDPDHAQRCCRPFPHQRNPELHGAADPKGLSRREYVFHQGDPVHSVYVVERGRVLLSRCQADGAVVTLFSARGGESFAEAALSSHHYHCDAVAAEDSIVVALPVAQLRRHFLADPASAMDLAMFFSRQVRDLRARLELRNVRSATDRTLQWLRAHASGNPQRLQLTGTWSELADELGLTREALYRALA